MWVVYAGCHSCGQSGHFARECPKQRSSGGRFGRGTRGGQSECYQCGGGFPESFFDFFGIINSTGLISIVLCFSFLIVFESKFVSTDKH